MSPTTITLTLRATVAAAAMWHDLLTAGLEPVLADRTQLAEPGGSAALTQQLRTQQAWDSAFLLLNLLGPLAEARTLLAGGRRLPTAVVAQLRDANYTDAAIAHLERRLAPALAESAELRRLAYAGEPEDVLAFVERLRTLDGVTQQVFAPNLVTRTQVAVSRYERGVQVVGSDGRAYTYGDSVRHVDLAGKSAAQLNQELLAQGFTKYEDFIRDPKTKQPYLVDGQAVRMDVYKHLDGGMVRVKFEGDPLNPFRSQPHVSKSVRNPFNETYEDFFFEAFKVDNAGHPLPKYPLDAANPYAPRTSEALKYMDQLMDQAHTDLP